MKLIEGDPKNNWFRYEKIANEELLEKEIKKVISQEIILYEDCISLELIYYYIKDNQERFYFDILRNSNGEEIKYSYYNLSVFDKKSINTNFVVDIKPSSVCIHSYDGCLKFPNFKYVFNLNNENQLYCNIKFYKKHIKGNENAFLKNIYLRIIDCPTNMQKYLYQLRKDELLKLEALEMEKNKQKNYTKRRKG